MQINLARGRSQPIGATLDLSFLPFGNFYSDEPVAAAAMTVCWGWNYSWKKTVVDLFAVIAVDCYPFFCLCSLELRVIMCDCFDSLTH